MVHIVICWPSDRHFGCKVVLSVSFLKSDTGQNYKTTGARGTDHPPFSNFLFTNLFSIKFLCFFIISFLFPYFNLFVSIFIQSYTNNNLHVSTISWTLRNKSWKPECVLSFNMGWRILIFYPELEARDKIYWYPPTNVKTHYTFWLPWIISILISLRVQIR